VNVSASAANLVSGPAKLGFRDVQARSGMSAGTYAYEVGDQVVTGWHWHELHQIEYAVQGVAQVETETARYLLPPQQAVWIPAGVEHCTTLTRVRTVAVFFDPGLKIDAGERVRVLAVAPVIREMILHARRWPIHEPSSDPAAAGFFATLARLITDSLDQENLLCLPTSQDPLIADCMRYTAANLAAATFGEVCAAVGASERSLRRAFAADTGMTWRQYLLESRLLQAMALLAQPELNVLAVATAVGFDTLSGFARAFLRYSGETPSAYRRRVLHS
jgi:AraC-like DNA-binding protein